MAIISASFNCYLRNKFTLAKYSKWGNNTQWVMFHLHSLNFTIKISQLWRLVEIAFEIFFFWITFSLEQYGSIRHRYPLLYVNMAQQPYLSCYVRYFYGHLLFIHQHISFIRHFFRGRILAEVSSGQKTHHNCCNLKHTMKKTCNTTSDALPTLSKKHACFMVPDNDFDIKKCPILISLRLVDHVLYTSNIYM